MRRAFIILIALVLIISLWTTCLMAEEHAEVRWERDYDKLLAELERQREENHALREEVRELKDEIIHLLSTQLERQQEQVHSMREMLQQQQEFMQGLLKVEYELRMAQQHMGMREFEANWDDDRDKENIEREMLEIRAAVAREPNNPELRTKMGHILWEVGEFHAAFEQFKTALSIDPDFGPAFESLEKLREDFPDISREMKERDGDATREPERDWNREPDRERERTLERSVGSVVSANREEVKLLTAAGETITFRVPFRRGEDNSRVVDKELAHLVGSLKPDERVEVWWEEVEGRRFIRRIHQLEEGK